MLCHHKKLAVSLVGLALLTGTAAMAATSSTPSAAAQNQTTTQSPVPPNPATVRDPDAPPLTPAPISGAGGTIDTYPGNSVGAAVSPIDRAKGGNPNAIDTSGPDSTAPGPATIGGGSPK